MSEQHLADMKRCSKCHSVYYCSRQCQEWDWRVGGHRLYCKRAIDSGLAAAAVATTAGNGVSAIAATLSAVAGAAGGTVIKELN
jgi:MYND finger